MNYEEFESDLIVLLDDDGEEHAFEVLDTLEHEGKTYYALLPVEDEGKENEDEDSCYYIFEVVEEDGEEQLSELEDDDLLDELDKIFSERFDALFGDED